MVDRHDEEKLRAVPKGEHAVLAKLSMPRSIKGVVRPRLHRAMDEARRAAAVWIVAPGGAGKTTLAATYITECKLPFLWYQVDHDDADPATFFYYFGELAKQLQADQEIFLPLLTPEYLHDIPGFARRYFRKLFTLLPEGGQLVLDNYQDLGDVAVMNEVLRNAMGEVPAGINLIVISRCAPPPALARLQVTGDLEVMTWEALRLTREETEAIVRECAGDVDFNIIHTLHQRSDGWVAALALMLKQLMNNGVDKGGVGLDSLDKVFDFFAREFFDGLSGPLREFLLQTSLLSHVTPSLAEAVSGNSDAGKILAELHRQNFFTTRRDLSERTYQYHALFREFLLARAVETYSREQYLTVLRRVGNLLEKHGREEEAVGLYLQSRAWEDAVPLILAQAPVLLGQARAQIVAGWIQHLPEEMIMMTPWLLFWRGVGQQFVNPFEARATLEHAYAGFVNDGDVLGQLSTASAIIDIAFFLRESLLDMTRWVRVLQDYLATNLQFPLPTIEARILSSLFSVLMYSQPQEPQLPHYAERLVGLLDADLEVNQQVLMGAHLVNYYAHAVGDIGACERIVMRMMPLLSSPRVTIINQIMWRCFCVLPCLLKGEGDAANKLVAPLLGLVRENNLPFMESIASFYVVLVRLCRDEANSAWPLLERMTAVVNTSQTADVAWLYLANCWCALSQADFATSFNQGRAALLAVAKVGAVLTEMDVSCQMALAHCQRGDYDEAFEYLVGPRELASDGTPRLRHQILLIEAYAYLRMGDRAQCHDILNKAFAIACRQRYFGSIYCWIPTKVMILLCSEALRAGIYIDYTRQLIMKRNLLPEDMNIEDWPWSVKIYALGPFRLVINGKLHSMEFKAQKPISLLKALVALGGKDVKEDRISEILWPDAEGDAAHSAFTTTLSRLRKLIGDDVITVKSGRLSLDSRQCWVDVWAFEDKINQWGKYAADPERLRALADRLAALYQGPFMSDEDGLWTDPLRQRLHSAYSRFISHCGRMLNVTPSEGKRADYVIAPGEDPEQTDDRFYPGYSPGSARDDEVSSCLAIDSVSVLSKEDSNTP